MGRAPSSCGVILAADDPAGIGHEKALLPWPPALFSSNPPQTLLSASIKALNSCNDMVIVVVGENELQLAPVIYGAGAALVRNPDSRRGQFGSLQVGLQEVMNRGRDTAMITLVDRPPVSSATLATLQSAFETAISSRKWAVIPEYRGERGYPIVIAREMFEAFLKAPPGTTPGEIEQQNRQYIEYLPTDDPFISATVNTAEEYAALTMASEVHRHE